MLAGLIWGLAFVIPELLAGVAATELAIGRYLVYGLLSVALLARLSSHERAALDGPARRTAIELAVTGNAGYYLLVVLAVQQAGAPLTALVVGTLPVVVALAGRAPLRTLAPSLVLVAGGLGAVNAAALAGADAAGGRSAAEIATGLGAAAGGVALWTWYAVRNAGFLAARPEIGAGAWSSAVGAGTLLIAALATPFVVAAGAPTAADHLAGFIAASVVLGVAVSWLATLLWNRASARLPLSLAGQLIVVETLSGTTYSYAYRGELPDPVTLAGFAALTAGVVTAVRRARPPVSAAGA